MAFIEIEFKLEGVINITAEDMNQAMEKFEKMKASELIEHLKGKPEIKLIDDISGLLPE